MEGERSGFILPVLPKKAFQQFLAGKLNLLLFFLRPSCQILNLQNMTSIRPVILLLLKLDSYNSLTAYVIACLSFNHRMLSSSHENAGLSWSPSAYIQIQPARLHLTAQGRPGKGTG